MHEAKMHECNSFVTLTYDDGFTYPGLVYRDFQLFMYRARKLLGPTRFFMSGEYGTKRLRPHFHALLFGQGFPDRKLIGDNLYRSPVLESLWRNGFSSVGDVTYSSAAYVAKYSLKKVSGPPARDHYLRFDRGTGEIVSVIPEFARMSLKPGIGYNWFMKYWKEVFLARDGIVIDGREVPSPRYYFDLLDRMDGDLHDAVEFNRYVHSERFKDDCTPERLLSREICALANERRSKERVL